MRTRLLLWDEEEVRKKKTLVLAVAFLLLPVLLGLYAATGPEGGLVAGATPTALSSPSAVATATLPVPTSAAKATPTASAMPVAKATATPVPPEQTVTPPATSVALGITPTASATPVAKATATPVPPEPTATHTAAPVALGPTPTPTVVPTVPLAAPVITTPPDGSVFKDDRPTIAGTAPPNTTVQLYDDETPVGTAAADDQGNWALVMDEPLEPGEHTVTAVASDEAGSKSSPSETVTLIVAIERLPTTGSSSWLERWLDRLLSITFP